MSVRASSPRGAGWLAELGPLPFVLLPFALLLVAVLGSSAARRAGAEQCLAAGTPRTVAQGVLRQASADLFVQEGARWRRIAAVCAGRARASCLQHCPGNAALESLVGAPVRVEFCGEHAVAVEVAGRRYAHPALAEPSLRMCG
ncbi:MAG: hypothetical protein ACK4MJ_09770 [Hylemonella sp.]